MEPSHHTSNEETTDFPADAEIPVETDIPLDSVTLARLIDEVRNVDMSVGRNYDRVHHRHNR